MPALIVTPAALTEDAISVEGEAYRHLFRALRLKQGESLRVVDGAGRARIGIIETVERSLAIVRLGEPAPDLEPALEVELVVAQLRPERASWLVEKATELGVRRVVWMQTERSQHDWPPAKLARFERIARSAVEQCGRSRLLELKGPLGWDEVLSHLRDSSCSLVAHCLTEKTVPDALRLSRRSKTDPVRVLIGPEGGFTDHEISQTVEAGCQAVGLGTRVLRVETAALAVASHLLAFN